jgi:hypothetical protein
VETAQWKFHNPASIAAAEAAERNGSGKKCLGLRFAHFSLWNFIMKKVPSNLLPNVLPLGYMAAA